MATEKIQSDTEQEGSNVLQFHAPLRLETPVSPEELAEYRRIRPQLLEMLEQWHVLTSNCLLVKKILAGDP